MQLSKIVTKKAHYQSTLVNTLSAANIHESDVLVMAAPEQESRLFTVIVVAPNDLSLIIDDIRLRPPMRIRRIDNVHFTLVREERVRRGSVGRVVRTDDSS
jgi:hypothetical protein